jgi:alanine racemase
VGILNFPESRFTLVRPGLAIYGLYPNGIKREDFGFEPVLSWRSSIIFLKEVKKGTTISYCGTWSAPRNSRIATVCVGYADGYPRSVSNRAEVIIKGKRCPVVGRVCMDMIMADVTGIGDVSIGDDVILIGKLITTEQMAEWAGTINYEICTGISARVPRIYNGCHI